MYTRFTAVWTVLVQVLAACTVPAAVWSAYLVDFGISAPTRSIVSTNSSTIP